MATVVRSHTQNLTAGPTESARQPWDLMLVSTAIYMLTNVARLHQLFPPLAVLKPIVVFAVLGTIIYFLDKRPMRSWRMIKQDPIVKLVTFIVIWATIGAPFGIYITQSAFFLYDTVYTAGILFLLTAASVRTFHDVRRLFYVYGGGLVLVTIIAMVQKPGSRRLGVAMYDSNDFGMLLVSAIPIAIYALARARRGVQKAAAGLGLVILATATVQTNSRGAFLALVAVVIYTLFFLKGVKPALRVATAVGVIAFLTVAATGTYWERMRTIFVPADDYNRSSMTGRIEIWKRGMGYMFALPVFGVGVDNFASAEGRSEFILARQEQGHGTKWSVAHSSFVQAGAEMGIPGFVAVIGLYVVALVHLRRLAKLTKLPNAPSQIKEGAAMGAALMGVMIGLGVAGAFVTQAFGAAVYASLGLVVGLLKVMRGFGIDTRRRVGPRTRGRVRPMPAAHVLEAGLNPPAG